MEGASDSIFLSPMSHIMPSPTKMDPRIAYQMRNVGYPLSTENAIIYREDRHTLLMKCIKVFLRCMKQMEGSSGSIYLPPMGCTMAFITNVDSQISYTMIDFGYTILVPMANVMLDHNERQPLLIKCFKPSLDALDRYKELLISSAYHLWVASCHFKPMSTLKLHTKYQILGTFLVW